MILLLRNIIISILILFSLCICAQTVKKLEGSYKCNDGNDERDLKMGITIFSGTNGAVLKNGSIVPCSDGGSLVVLKQSEGKVSDITGNELFGEGFNFENTYSAINTSSEYNISTIKPFVQLSGNVSVTPIGSVQYSLPIEMPLGVGSFSPKLSISYNSISSNGLLGQGFDLQGLSAISRVGKNMYQEDKFRKMSFSTSEDRFALDGNRLILKNANDEYGGNETNYITENETFLDIKVFSNENIPNKFLVIDKNGNQYEYFSKAFGVNNNNSNIPYAYYITKSIDVNGNEINYSYINYDGNMLIDKIYYNSNLEPVELKFNYLPRVESNEFVLGNASTDKFQTIKLNAILGNIEIKVNGQNFKKYLFQYEKINMISRLNTIKVFDSKNVEGNPIKIQWGEANTNIEQESITIPDLENVKKIYEGDFCGDMKSDLAFITDKKFLLYERGANNAFVKKVELDVDIDYLNLTLTSCNVFSVDRKDKDQIYLNFSSHNRLYKKFFFKVNTQDILNSLSITAILYPQIYQNNKGEIDYPNKDGYLLITSVDGTMMCADFDGDGNKEIVGIDKAPEFKTISKNAVFHRHPVIEAKSYFAMDINGDGAAEIVATTEDKTYVYAFDNEQGGFKLLSENLTQISDAKKPLIGDFNGDGKLDILGLYKTDGWIDYTWLMTVKWNSYKIETNMYDGGCTEVNKANRLKIYKQFNYYYYEIGKSKEKAPKTKKFLPIDGINIKLEQISNGKLRDKNANPDDPSSWVYPADADYETTNFPSPWRIPFEKLLGNEIGKVVYQNGYYVNLTPYDLPPSSLSACYRDDSRPFYSMTRDGIEYYNYLHNISINYGRRCLFENYTDTQTENADLKHEGEVKYKNEIEKLKWKLFQSSGNNILENQQLNSKIIEKMSLKDNLFTAAVYDLNDVKLGYDVLRSSAVYSEAFDINTYYLNSGDLNWDGLTDLIKVKYNKSTTPNVKSHATFTLGINNGKNLNVAEFTYEGDINMESITIGDYNNDGFSDILFWDNTIKKLQVIYYGKNSKHLLVSQITNNLGEHTKIFYENTINNDVYVSEPLNNTDAVKFDKPMNIVSSIWHSNGVSISYNITDYIYTNCLFLENKRNVLGYEKIKEIKNNGTTLETNYKFLSNSQTLLPLNSSLFRNSDNKLISNSVFDFKEYKTTSTSSNTSLKNNGYYIYNESVTQTDYANKVKKVTSYVYDLTNIDNENELLSTETNIYDISSNVEELKHKSSIAFEYEKYGNLRKIKDKTITETRTNEIAFTIKHHFDYYNVGGFLKSHKNYYGTDDEVVTEYGYDSYGNITSKSVTANVPIVGGSTKQKETRSENYSYYDNKIYLRQKTNALEYTTTYQVDRLQGNILSTKTADGLETKFGYNENNNENVSQLNPDGTSDYTYTSYSIDFENSGSVFKKTQYSTGTGTLETWYDGQGRKLIEKAPHINGQKTVIKYYYDEFGRLSYKSYPYFDGGSTTKKIQYEYYSIDEDLLQRLKSVTDIDRVTTYTYNTNAAGTEQYRATKVEAPDGTISSNLVDAMGLVIETMDSKGKKIVNTYYSHGGIKETKVDASKDHTISFTYNTNTALKTSMTDPNLGTVTFDYNGFGELCYQKNAKNQETKFYYDKLGRLLTKINVDGNYTFEYNEGIGTASLGLLKKETAPNGNEVSYSYDNLGRLTSKSEKIKTKTFNFAYTYNALSQIEKVTYPNGVNINYHYNQTLGHLESIKYDNDSKKIWDIGTENVMGQPLTYVYGDAINEIFTYNNYFINTNKQTKVRRGDEDEIIFEYGYTFDPKNGNLLTRHDKKNNLKEKFQYNDGLDRLNVINKVNPVNDVALTENNITYSSDGNIEAMTQVGNYKYEHTSKTHAVTGITDLAPAFNGGLQQISYTSFDKVSEITEGRYKYKIEYGADEERRYMEEQYQTNNVYVRQSEDYYLEGYEEHITNPGGSTEQVEQRIYVYGPYGEVAMHLTRGTSKNIYFTHTDHLGSVLAVTNTNGTVVEQHSYDAWGNPRNPLTWQVEDPSDSRLYRRGFTNHEHINKVHLINMNGRMYDPIVGRFLSPDPFIQDPSNIQSHNRYSYVLNNPLKYTDPSGYITATDWIAGGMIVAGAVLSFTPLSPLGSSLIQGGVMHFVYTGNAMTSNPGMSWDEASISAGLSMTVTFTPGWDAQQRQSMPNEGNVNYGNGQYYGTEPVAFTNSNKAMNSNLLASNSKKGVYSDSWVQPRNMVRSPLSLTKDLYDHYLFGKGKDFVLSKSDVDRMYNSAVKNNAINWKKAVNIGNGKYEVPVNFYKSDLGDALSFGRAKFVIQDNRPVGFYDYYNFDKKSWGERTWYYETLTRAGYNKYGKDFNVIYDE